MKVGLLLGLLLLSGCGNGLPTTIQAWQAAAQDDQAAAVGIAKAATDKTMTLCAAQMQAIYSVKSAGPASAAVQLFETQQAVSNECAGVAQAELKSVGVLSSFLVLLGL
jgi:hypothetical protein